MQYKNTSAFSIVLALGLMLLLSFTGLYLLEYIVPFSRNVKGVENASKAFYQSYAALEEAILQTYSGAKIQKGYEPAPVVFSSRPIGGNSSVISNGSTIPLTGRGNSQFDPNWNQLSLTHPISLFVGRNRLPGTADIDFHVRVPDGRDLQGTNEEFIMWQLSSQTGSLTVASGALISENDMNGGAIPMRSQLGTPLIGSDENFGNFYQHNCATLSEECILKIAVIRPLVSTSGNSPIPYLEYQIYSDRQLPFQESYIHTEGKSYGFKKQLEVVLPHRVTSSAFDFTVLQ